MNDQEKYDAFKQAVKTGGPCEICGWKDGQGQRTCFYSKELGVVRHENSLEATMADMSQEQKHLFQLRQDLVYISEELREKQIAHVAQEHHLYEERQRKLVPDRPPTIDKDGNPISEEDWIARYRNEQMKKGLSTDPQFTGWFQEHWWIPADPAGTEIYLPEHRGLEKVTIHGSTTFYYTAYMTHVYEPHSCGKGHKYMESPYHFACTGCSTEIKLWEHGVDYDVG